MTGAAMGIIGGTGLGDAEWLTESELIEVNTPFGAPSSSIRRSSYQGTQLFFLSRHGPGHTLLPSEVNYRANIYALKVLGVKWCIGIGAVGSLQEGIKPGDALIPDQIIDRTRNRQSTFFGDGIVAHINFADPFCEVLRGALCKSSTEVFSNAGGSAHPAGTYLCMEGPALSTRAESELYRTWGADIIGMTLLPEAKLAREAEIAFSSLALVTDFDCWKGENAAVDIEAIFSVLQKSSRLAQEIIRSLVIQLKDLTPSAEASDALKNAIISTPDRIPSETRKNLAPLIERYIGGTPS